GAVVVEVWITDTSVRHDRGQGCQSGKIGVRAIFIVVLIHIFIIIAAITGSCLRRVLSVRHWQELQLARSLIFFFGFAKWELCVLWSYCGVIKTEDQWDDQ
ncbi:hypothetical protein DRN79_04315, partial [Methanosarcinales archaeon]